MKRHINYEAKTQKYFSHQIIADKLELLEWRQKEAICFNWLHSHCSTPAKLPQTVMSMSATAICHIINDIILNDRSSIIEFGSGNSTVYIAEFIKQSNREIDFISIDDNLAWLKLVESWLLESKLDQAAATYYVPTSECSPADLPNNRGSKWFDTSRIKKIITDKKFDLVIVDGPQGRLSPFVRSAALPILIENNLASSFGLLLDDTDRDEEMEIFSNWCQLIPNAKPYLDYKYGFISTNSPYFSFYK